MIFKVLFVPEFFIFLLMLAGLIAFHRWKLPVTLGGFIALSAAFLYRNGFGGYVAHFENPHEYSLLYNLLLLLPGFALVSYYFEQSGFDEKISRKIGSDNALLWTVFGISTLLDNIAAAMIGGVLVSARYGKNAPFILLVAVIAAANLGGAGSFAGDTTTVMLFVSGVSILSLAKGFVAAVVAQLVLTKFFVKHDYPTGNGGAASLKTLNGRMFLPLLAVPGLALGNVLFDLPGVGLWTGLFAGMALGRVRPVWEPVRDSVGNTFFLALLVGAAGLLPLNIVQPLFLKFGKDTVAVAFGLLSPWLDNIPLTKIALDIGGFDWGLVAYCVGYGGSATWFGSSAGVALALRFPQLYEARRWVKPFFIVMVSYFAGVLAYMLVFKLIAGLFK